MCIGFIKKGQIGSFLAWLGFTLPSAIIMILFALGYLQFNEQIAEGSLRGIKIVVIVIVFQAVFGMCKQFLNNTKTSLIAAFTTIVAFSFNLGSYQFILIIISGIFGLLLFKEDKVFIQNRLSIKYKYKYLIYILLFIILFTTLPILQNLFDSKYLLIADKFFRTGSLVFGGGHVVLPLLQNEVLNANLIDQETFIFGYGLAQAIPGPLFTFSGFLGTTLDIGTNRILSVILCLIMIFMPSFLLVLGLMPYWNFLRSKERVRRCLIGINACVVGLLIATFLNPVIINTINDVSDFGLLITASILILLFKFPQWLSVLIMGLAGFVLNYYF